MSRRMRIVVTNREYGELLDSWARAIETKPTPKVDVTVFTSWAEMAMSWAGMATCDNDKRKSASVVVISRLADVASGTWKKTRRGGGMGLAKYLLISEGMPIESVAPRVALLGVRDPRRIHVAREKDERSISEMFGRLIHAAASSAERPSILDAWIEGEDLVLLSEQFDRLYVPFDKLTPYIGKNRRKARQFEIDEDGRFLFWPHADAHLGWEELQQIIDPTRAVTAEKKTARFNRRYGAAIRSLREEAGIRQSDIPGLSARQLRRIEQGKQAATSSSLKALARAHGMVIEEYLKELATRCSDNRSASGRAA